jgi:hypothetical protein
MKITLILITISKKYKSRIKWMVKSEGVEVLSLDKMTEFIIEINLIGRLIIKRGLIIIIIKAVIKSTPEIIFRHKEVASLVHQELIEITKKAIIHLMKEIIKVLLIREVVTNIVAESVDLRVILGRKLIITKKDQIITNLEILIKKIDGMKKKEIPNLKAGIMK